jgi:SAM-dependent methyltransferase
VFYGSDLAHVHDAGFGWLARAAAPALVRMLRRAEQRDGLVVDLACGTGIGAEILMAAGYDVLGVDLSPEQLAIARRRAPGARLHEGSLFDFELPPCVAVTIIGEGLSYAADVSAGRAAARRVFERAHAALAPGGLLVFDVVEPGRERREPRRSWHEGDGWMICVETWEEPEKRLLQRRIATFRRDEREAGAGWRRSDEHHTQHAYDRDEMLADLRATGFVARTLRGYGSDFRFRRGHVGFAATKPRR